MGQGCERDLSDHQSRDRRSCGSCAGGVRPAGAGRGRRGPRGLRLVVSDHPRRTRQLARRGRNGPARASGRVHPARDRGDRLHRDRRQVDAGPAGGDPLPALRARRVRVSSDPVAAPRNGRHAAGSRWPHRRARPASARRRGRVHHVVQLPDREHGGQDRAGARNGEHRHRASRRAGPAGDHQVGRAARGSRVSAGCGEPCLRVDPRERGGACCLAGRRHGELHRFQWCGCAHRRGGRSGYEAPTPRARRKGRGTRARRRRRQERHWHDRFGMDVPLGPDLYRADACDRPPVDL